LVLTGGYRLFLVDDIEQIQACSTEPFPFFPILVPLREEKLKMHCDYTTTLLCYTATDANVPGSISVEDGWRKGRALLCSFFFLKKNI
jgi:hypothetical protein